MKFAQAASRLVEWVLDVAREVPGEGEPEDRAMDYVVSEVTGGKSLVKFVEQEGLDWPIFSAWVSGDEKRQARYQAALKARGVVRKERLLDGWWDTADMVVEEVVTHADVHRAREALGKAEGVFRQGEGKVGGSITVTFDDVDARA